MNSHQRRAPPQSIFLHAARLPHSGRFFLIVGPSQHLARAKDMKSCARVSST